MLCGCYDQKLPEFYFKARSTQHVTRILFGMKKSRSPQCVRSQILGFTSWVFWWAGWIFTYVHKIYWYTVCILYILYTPYIHIYLYKVYSIGTSPSYVGFRGLVVQPTGKVCQSAFAKTAELNSGKHCTRKQLRYWAEANASFFSSNRFRNGFYPYVSREKQHVTWVLSLIGGSRVTRRQSLFSHFGWVKELRYLPSGVFFGGLGW